MAPAQEIRAGLVSEGRGQHAWHALRADGTAACSNYIPVSYRGDKARDIAPGLRCKSKACQKLFTLAALATGEQP